MDHFLQSEKSRTVNVNQKFSDLKSKVLKQLLEIYIILV